MKNKNFGLIRIATASPKLRVADVEFNAQQMLKAIKLAHGDGASFILFPELSLTGYSCGDLFYQPALLESAKHYLLLLLAQTKNLAITSIVGLPIEIKGCLYNCAAILSRGKILGVVPKQYIPNTKEFYEKRWFHPGFEINTTVDFSDGAPTPLSSKILFKSLKHSVIFGVEICEDLWAPIPPSSYQSIYGAQIIFNLSASNELIGKGSYRRDLVRQQSARCIAAYVYASAGPGESSTDLVFSGHSMIAENGLILTESKRFEFESQIIIADIDIQKINFDRFNSSSFGDANYCNTSDFKIIEYGPDDEVVDYLPSALLGSKRVNLKHPFVPTNFLQKSEVCEDIFAIQSAGLAKRLRHLNLKKVVIGVSGGLDSTLALLVCCNAFKMLDLDLGGIIAVSLPGFGTSERTKSNALKLIDLLGAQSKSISILTSVTQHFLDIGHDPNLHNVVYENSQARERTQVLMDLANMNSAIVIGTGDLSESALGWCTFNGDHISMYHVNAGVPKTLVRYLIEWCGEFKYAGDISQVLLDICDTPVSPELLPLGVDGDILQITEDLVGPYELHDYFLYAMVRCGYSPKKILYMASIAFEGIFQIDIIRHWLKIFLKRFFSQQFKRSSMPDGPKVGSVALSPRGDWRMPSDACVSNWLADLDNEIIAESL